MSLQLVPTLKSATLATGVTLPYVEQGDPEGIPMILLHGVTDSWHSYERLLPYLPPSIRAYALTQRGHGDAGRPPEGYGPDDFAADVAAIMDFLELPSAFIVGHSLGACIAPRVALHYPERVRGLVLMGAFRNWRDNPDVTMFWQEAIAPLADPIDPAFVREFQESTLAQAVPDDFLELVIGESLKVPARVWRATFGEFIDVDFESALPGIAAPTLILWGDQDAYSSRADQDGLAQAFPNARLTVYEGVGHALHWEEPQRVAADLITFIANRDG